MDDNLKSGDLVIVVQGMTRPGQYVEQWGSPRTRLGECVDMRGIVCAHLNGNMYHVMLVNMVSVCLMRDELELYDAEI